MGDDQPAGVGVCLSTLCPFEAIVQRLSDEGRLRPAMTVPSATAAAFAMSTATVYEELAVRRPTGLDGAIAAVTDAVLGAIIEPGAVARDVPPPDWVALETTAAARALQAGVSTYQLTPTWFGSGAWKPGGDAPAGIGRAGSGRGGAPDGPPTAAGDR